MTSTPYSKPLPVPSEETAPFWEGTKQRELRIPYCRHCQRHFFYPRSFCPHCFGTELEWRKASGRGRLYTYGIQYRPAHPGFMNELPYVTAIVELEEGVRLMTNLVGVEPDPEKIRCDAPVEVVFEDVTDEITLPKFRLV
jgi:hypothetical protein